RAASTLLVVQQDRWGFHEAPGPRGPVQGATPADVGSRLQRRGLALQQDAVCGLEQLFFLDRAPGLPEAQCDKAGRQDQRQQPSGGHAQCAAHDCSPMACHNRPIRTLTQARPHETWRCLMKTLLIVAVLLVILWNLGAGLYYMLVDKGGSKRTVNALTRRIAISIALILGVILAA